MVLSGPMKASGLGLLVQVVCSAAVATAAEPPKVVNHVVVYGEKGRFAGWPANHGMWAWGDEILVGFSRGFYKDRGSFHHINKEKPEEFMLARSKDGGLTWAVEQPQPAGALIGTPGMRHGIMPPGSSPEQPTELTEPIDFTHADFAMTIRMENPNSGTSRFYFSYDRGHHWQGPYRLPLFGQPGVMGRTDMIVNGPHDCIAVLTASKPDHQEGRPFCARTTDGGLTWKFLSYIGPEPIGYSIMPSTVRVSGTELVTTVRVLEKVNRSWIDAYASHDNGLSWSFLSTAEPDTGEGNPPSLLRLADGRLCMFTGIRIKPHRMVARMSGDEGKSWSEPIVLRDDGGAADVGYPRSIIRPDGKIVIVYYYNDRTRPDRYIAATIWDPGKP
jgi:hypothetical protein